MPTGVNDVIKLNEAEFILNRLLEGGFTLPHDNGCGLVILIRGKAGTGKSTLALQILNRIEKHLSGKRIYCSLEQSQTDIRYKLASMGIAQAIHSSQKADQESGLFVCDEIRFFDSLKEGCCRNLELSDPIRTQMRAQLAMIRPLLHGDDGRTGNDDDIKNANDSLVSIFNQELFAEDKHSCWPIEIRDGSEGAQANGMQSRVLQASRMLANLLDDEPWDADNREERPIVVMDGLSLLTRNERATLMLQSIADKFRKYCKIGILVYEPGLEDGSSLDHHADVVIELGRKEKPPINYQIHEMTIRKTRYQSASLGKHQYKIRESGLIFYPSLHFQVRHRNNMDFELARSYLGPKVEQDQSMVSDQPVALSDSHRSVTKGSLIDLIFKPEKGESVLLLGARNTFKTQLSLDFLSRGNWGCKNDLEKEGKLPPAGLLLNLCNNTPAFERDRQWKCPWKNSRFIPDGYPSEDQCKNCKDQYITHINLFYQRPGCITADEFFHYVVERLEFPRDSGVERLVFWDLTQLDYRFPLLREDEMLIPALMDKLKSLGITYLLVGAGNAKYTNMASDMGDHVLFVWRSIYRYNVPVTNGQCKVEYSQKQKGTDDDVSSLMLYVDRTTSTATQSGKAVYAIPIYEQGTKLMIPSTDEELQHFRFDPLSGTLANEDRDEIKKIMDMQGVS